MVQHVQLRLIRYSLLTRFVILQMLFGPQDSNLGLSYDASTDTLGGDWEPMYLALLVVIHEGAI